MARQAIELGRNQPGSKQEVALHASVLLHPLDLTQQTTALFRISDVEIPRESRGRPIASKNSTNLRDPSGLAQLLTPSFRPGLPRSAYPGHEISHFAFLGSIELNLSGGGFLRAVQAVPGSPNRHQVFGWERSRRDGNVGYRRERNRAGLGAHQAPVLTRKQRHRCRTFSGSPISSRHSSHSLHSPWPRPS